MPPIASAASRAGRPVPGEQGRGGDPASRLQQIVASNVRGLALRGQALRGTPHDRRRLDGRHLRFACRLCSGSDGHRLRELMLDTTPPIHRCPPASALRPRARLRRARHHRQLHPAGAGRHQYEPGRRPKGRHDARLHGDQAPCPQRRSRRARGLSRGPARHHDDGRDAHDRWWLRRLTPRRSEAAVLGTPSGVDQIESATPSAAPPGLAGPRQPRDAPAIKATPFSLCSTKRGLAHKP